MAQQYSRQRLEPARGRAHAAMAATQFVAATKRHLPAKAVTELQGIENAPSSNLERWLDRWHLNCDCVREWASGYLVTRAYLGAAVEPEHVGRGFGDDLPAEWWQRLREWNSTTLDAMGWDPRDYGRAVDVGVTTSPIAANPLAESEEQFVRRARAHWQARAAKARTCGYTAVTTTREVERDCDWLARAQIYGASRESLGEVKTVEAALARLRKQIGLKAPRGRGRPRKNPARDTPHHM